LISNIRNIWVELILEDKIARERCPRVHKHTVKLILDPCGTLGL